MCEELVNGILPITTKRLNFDIQDYSTDICEKINDCLSIFRGNCSLFEEISPDVITVTTLFFLVFDCENEFINNFSLYLLLEETEMVWNTFGFQLSGRNRGSQTLVNIKLFN